MQTVLTVYLKQTIKPNEVSKLQKTAQSRRKLEISESHTKRIYPTVDFGGSDSWTIRFHIDEKQLKQIANAKLVIPNAKLEFYGTTMQYDKVILDLVLNSRERKKFSTKIIRSIPKVLESNKERSEIKLRRKAICRIHQQLFRSLLDYEDDSVYPDYERENKRAYSPYLEYTVYQSSKSSSPCEHAGRVRRHAREILKYSNYYQNDCSNGPWESFVKPEVLLNTHDIRIEPQTINIKTCVNPKHHRHPLNTKRQEGCLQETLLNIAKSSCDALSTSDIPALSYHYFKKEFRTAARDLFLICMPAAFDSATYAYIEKDYQPGSSRPYKQDVRVEKAIVKSCQCT